MYLKNILSNQNNLFDMEISLTDIWCLLQEDDLYDSTADPAVEPSQVEVPTIAMELTRVQREHLLNVDPCRVSHSQGVDIYLEVLNILD